MFMSNKSKTYLWLPALALVLAGCMSTKQVAYGDRDKSALNFDRTVEVKINASFYSEAPECVTVLPVKTPQGEQGPVHVAVEDSIARYLRGKMTRVIDRIDRQYLTRQMAVDLSHQKDRQTYARNTGCKHFVELRPWGSGNQYLFFWSREALGVEAVLINAHDQQPLWKARHVASRSDGGLPLNPISAVFSAFEANSLSGDTEVPLSLADDVARNIVATLPGMRRSPYEHQNAYQTDKTQVIDPYSDNPYSETPATKEKRNEDSYPY